MSAKEVGVYIFNIAGIAAIIFVPVLLLKPSGEQRPYALKQNGDTLFIPTQVVVKHDTLVVIRTEERRPVQDSINAAAAIFSSFGGTLTFSSNGGYVVVGNTYGAKHEKTYKQRDTIYEHKIIYY